MSDATKQRKRLLVLSSTYPRWLEDVEPGFVHELSKRLVDEFEVSVLCPHGKGAKISETLEGVKVQRYRYAPESLESLVNNGGIIGNLKKSPLKWLLVPAFLLSQLINTYISIRRFKPDIIHAHWIVPQGLVLVLAQIFVSKTPFIITSHGADLFALRGQLFGKLKLMVINRADHITVVSDAMKQQAIALGVNAYKVSVMPMGVDFSKFSSKDTTRNNSEILFVGRLVEKKGLAYLIQALDIVRKKLPDVHLNIIGFGPEEESLKRLVGSLNLNLYVSFLGAKKQTELVEYYQKATLFVAPFIEASNGDQEGLGLVTIEAVASGCPVLIGDVEAVKDFPVERVDVKNAEVFAERIIEALTGNNLDASFQEIFKRRFDWEYVARTYSELFKSKCRQ